VTDRITRRRFIGAAAGLVAGGGAAAGLAERLFGRGHRPLPLGEQPSGLPARQHAWTHTLTTDEHGNPIAPRFDRLLFFDVARPPDASSIRTLEATLRTLERRYRWSPEGLLFTLGWGPAYFHDVLGTPSPVPPPEALSDFELPELDRYHAALHLAADDEQRLADVDAELGRGLDGIFLRRETRTGFAGAGLPAKHQHADGIPAGRPVLPAAPLFMGFKSGLRKNQATEDDVTIPDGPLAGGTTMHVSYMRLRLDSWYAVLDERDRVARMYAPQLTPTDVARLTDDAPSSPNRYGEAARRYGVVGHAQTSARARRNGRPLIIRRDFDTVDGGLAGLHFVALQRSIADFVTTRKAMNAASAANLNPAITDTVNNGINEFIVVARRGNYVVPPRALRSFPLYSGQRAALDRPFEPGGTS